MDETVGVGVGPAGRARHAGPTPEPRRRMSVRRERETVPRLPRGGDLEPASREPGAAAAAPGGWRDRFLAGGGAPLGSRPADARDAGIGRPRAKAGEPTVAAALPEAKIGRSEARRPSARRRPGS